MYLDIITWKGQRDISSLSIEQHHDLCTWIFMPGVEVGGQKIMFSTGVKIEVEMNNPRPRRKPGLQAPFPQTVKVKKNKIK